MENKDTEFGIGSLPPTGPQLGIMPPLQPLGTVNGTTIGTAPVTIGLLQPEPIPADPDEYTLLHPQTISTELYRRNLMRLPGFHPDALVQSKGYDVLDDMKTMSAYSSPLRLLKYSILYKAWETLPRVNGNVVKSDHPRYDKAKEIADFCQFALNSIIDPDTHHWTDAREVFWYVLDAVHHGNSTQEVVWRIENNGEYKGKRVFSQFIPRSPKQITYNVDPFTNKVISLNNYVGYYQSFINPYKKFLQYIYQPEKGLPYGRGVARACYKHVVAIDELLRMYGVALERFGSGFLKGTTNDVRPKNIADFLAQLDAIRLGGSVVTTIDKPIELMNLPGGALDSYPNAIRFHVESIAKEIIGQNLTTSQGDGKGSYALAQAHQDTEEYFKGYLRRELELCISKQLYYWLVVTNYGEEYLDCLPDHWLGVVDYQEMKLLSDYVTTLGAGAWIDPRYDDDIIRKRIHFPLLPTVAEDRFKNPILLPGQEKVQATIGGKNASTS